MPARGLTGTGPMEVTVKTSDVAGASSKPPFYAPRIKRQRLWSLKAPSFRKKHESQLKLQSQREHGPGQ